MLTRRSGIQARPINSRSSFARGFCEGSSFIRRISRPKMAKSGKSHGFSKCGESSLVLIVLWWPTNLLRVVWRRATWSQSSRAEAGPAWLTKSSSRSCSQRSVLYFSFQSFHAFWLACLSSQSCLQAADIFGVMSRQYTQI